jgi:toxin ParE1/3/4
MAWRLSEKAEADLQLHYAYGLEKWGIRQADRLFDQFFDAFEEIAAFPEACRDRVEIEQGLRIKVIQNHLIIFSIEPDAVVIQGIVHGASDWQNEL